MEVGTWRATKRDETITSNMKIIIKTPFLICLILFNLFITGCSVAPWERGNLAKPQMALDSHPGQTEYRGHAYGSREAATGSSVGAGGGCGCY